MIVEGKQQYLYDETGRRYLDAFGGIVTVSVGHSHPKLVKAVNEQNEKIQHTTTIYLNDQVGYHILLLLLLCFWPFTDSISSSPFLL